MAKKALNPIDVHIGQQVRARRMQIGMSQGKLGEALGVTFQQVQKYEKGTNRIGAGRLQDLADVLGVGIDYFYENAPGSDRPPSAPDPLAQMLSTPEGVKLANAFLKIRDPQARRLVINLAETLQKIPAPKKRG